MAEVACFCGAVLRGNNPMCLTRGCIAYMQPIYDGPLPGDGGSITNVDIYIDKDPNGR